MPKLTIVLAALLAAATTNAANGATYYVRKSGSDGNAGTSANQAWLTIQKAASTAVAGDVIYVGAGTYNEFVQPANDGAAGSLIRYLADSTGAATGDAGAVIINGGSGNSRAWECVSDNYIELNGFLLTGGTGSAVNWNASAGGVIRNCEIYSSLSDGIVVRAGAVVTIENCWIHHNVDYGIEVIDGATVIIQDTLVESNTKGGIGAVGNAANNTTMRRCRVRSNASHGLYLDNGTTTLVNLLVTGNSQDAINIGAAGGTHTLWHVTLAYNTGDGLQQAGGTVNLRNSIVAYNSQEGLNYDLGTCTHTHNCVHSNTLGNFSGTLQSTGETTASPLFWSASCLELRDGSPCINTGTNPSGMAPTDLELVARPSGGGYDMGCYETVTVTYNSLVHAYTQLSPYAWWRLNESGGSTAADQMNRHHGTHQNGVVLNNQGVPIGGNNKAAAVDGVDDRVNVGTVNPTVSAMSFIGWMRLDDFDVANGVLLAKATGTADSNYFWSLGTNTASGQSRVHFRFRAGGTTSVVTASSGGLSPLTWVFIAGVYDGQAMVVYKDGVEVGRISKSGTPNLSGAAGAALGDNPLGGAPLDGRIDEVAIFTTALKPRQIAAIYAAALKGSFTGVSKPKLWGIDEDDSMLFSMTNYDSPGTSLTTYGKLKYNNGGTITDLGVNFNVSALAINRQGRMYLTCDSNFGAYTAPVLMSFDLAGASTTQPNVVSIIGQIPTGTEIRGLALDPLTADLYALRSDGWLFVISTTNASIVRTVGLVTGLGDSVTVGEDIVFDPYGNLYAMDDGDDEFYRVNKSNGAILDAASGGALGVIQGFAWDHLNSKVLVSVTDTGAFLAAATSLTSVYYISGLPTYGLTDVEAIGFMPSEGVTGVGGGIRVLSWKEQK